MRKFAAALVIIVVGVLWLLNVLKVGPGIDWVWTGGLAVAGALVLLLGGRTRRAFVIGVLLLGTSITSALRQTGHLPADTELPILVILMGVLMLSAQFVIKRENEESAKS